ncbi:Uncharacterized protein pbN1_18210 [Aromatoleum bremense]|nr:Uncharacterized protein pbN1_18210 [Aromatoleum bremense]
MPRFACRPLAGLLRNACRVAGRPRWAGRARRDGMPFRRCVHAGSQHQ